MASFVPKLKPLKRKSCCCLIPRGEDAGGLGGGRYTGGIHTVTHPEERVFRDIRYTGSKPRSQSCGTTKLKQLIRQRPSN